MRILAFAAIIAALAAPSFAQDTAGSNKHHRADKNATSEAPRIKANDKDYKAALDRLPKQKYDPWGTTRSTGNKP